MNEPNKTSDLLASLQEKVEGEVKNREAVLSCPKHKFWPIIDGQGIHTGGYRCAHCSGEVSEYIHRVYNQGKRDA